MAVAVAEARDLVLDRRAIARPAPLDRAGEQRRAVEPGADDVMGALIGAGDRAGQLRELASSGASADIVQRVASLGCAASRAQSIVRPSSRGGVPVLSRPWPSPISRTCAPSAMAAALADAPARPRAPRRGNRRVEEGAGGDDDRAASMRVPSLGHRRRRQRRLSIRASRSPSIRSTPCVGEQARARPRARSDGGRPGRAGPAPRCPCSR